MSEQDLATPSAGSPRQSEPWTSLLAACDDMLRYGGDVPPLPSDLSAPLQQRLHKGLACLQWLHARFAVDNTPPDGTEITPTELQFAPDGALQRLGRFVVREVLGQGGFGTVYRASDPHLGREIALKVPHLHRMSRPEMQARFRLEALAVARLDHPGIVKVFEAGSCGPVCYLASELCSPRTLADLLRTHGPLPAGAAARLLQELAQALDHAHRRGVLHRDLKPANILLMTNDECRMTNEGATHSAFDIRHSSFGIPKIADFGLAKLDDDEAALTRTGTILGSASYMAPEQASGSGKDVGVAADVHALGIIAYELLTGQTPYAAATPMETLERLRSQEPVRPRQLCPDVPADLETICLKCLRKAPEQRYASAADLAEDLRRFRAGEPILARPVGAGERAVKWMRRHPQQTALVTVLVLALTTVTWFWWIAVAERREADAARRKTEEFAQMPIKALGDFTDRVLDQREFGGFHLAKMRAAVLEAALPHLENYLHHDSLNDWAQIELASNHLRLGQARHMLGKVEEGKQHLQIARRLAESAVAKDPRSREKRRQLARIWAEIAYFRAERSPEVVAILHRARELAHEAGDLGLEGRCHFNIALQLVGPWGEEGSPEERRQAIAHLRQAWKLTEALTANEDNPQSGLPPCTVLDHIVLLITGRLLCVVDVEPTHREKMVEVLLAAAERTRRRYASESWAWSSWGDCIERACIEYARIGQSRRGAELVQEAYALLAKQEPVQANWPLHIKLEFRQTKGRIAHQVAEALHDLKPRPQEEVIRWSALVVELLDPLLVLDPENAMGQQMLGFGHLRFLDPLRSTGGPALWNHYRQMRKHMEAYLQHNPDLNFEKDYASYCWQYVEDLANHGRSTDATQVLEEMIARMKRLQQQHPDKAKQLPLKECQVRLQELQQGQKSQ